jgi:hypothetical protein
MNESELDKTDFHQEKTGAQKAYKIIDANGIFRVYEDGHVEGTSAHFYDGSKFEGTIEATGGTIGGLDIEEWKEMGFSVRITSSAGLVLKGKTPSTTLTAALYRGNTEVKLNEDYFEDTDGKKYALEYEWFHGKALMSGETTNEISVTIGSDNASETYTCKIYL